MDPNKKYITISELMNSLAEYMSMYGDIPILVSSDETESGFLRPLESNFVCQITEEATDEKQCCVVLTNYEIKDIEDEENEKEFEV